jgi:hypothetical protein
LTFRVEVTILPVEQLRLWWEVGEVPGLFVVLVLDDDGRSCDR